MDLVPGRRPVLECLRARKRKAHKLFLLQDAKGMDFLREAAGDIPVVECPRAELDRLLPHALHQGVLLQADPLPILNADVWAGSTFPDDSIIVVLDGVEDPHNFGAIVRSATACGARAVVYAKDRAAPVSPAAVKSAAGGMEHIDLVQAPNLVRSIDALKKAGFWIAALHADAPQPIWEADLKGRVALVIGGEGKGIRRLVNERSDFHLRIPLPGPITTLNASVSAAIALAECTRQRVARRTP
jgi:23S rRNA (guanosine2251-2'-O)-methyltransferase